MRQLLMLAMIVGCSGPQASDLDGDGIADDADPCVAGFPDEDIDADGDQRSAAEDLCPHDANALAGDLDFDGIPDACDPFPAVTAGDTRRCVTSFRVPWMSASYLYARAGETAWDLRAPLTASSSDNVSVVSMFPQQHASVSFDVLGTATFAATSSNFKLWLRANPDAPSAQDLACGIEVAADGTHSLYVWHNNLRHAPVTLPIKIDGKLRLRATVQDLATSTVLCRVTAGGMSIATRLGAQLVAGGRYGFAASGVTATITSLVIDSNEAARPF